MAPNLQEHRFCHQPTGTMGIALAAKYNMDNLTISGGVNYTTFGDKTITSTIADEFSGNSVLSYGIKVGVNF